LGLEPKWYSKKEYIAILKPILIGLGSSEEEVDKGIASMGKSSISESTYSLDNWTLVLTPLQVEKSQGAMLIKYE
jgi:hypothetical protein